MMIIEELKKKQNQEKEKAEAAKKNPQKAMQMKMIEELK